MHPLSVHVQGLPVFVLARAQLALESAHVRVRPVVLLQLPLVVELLVAQVASEFPVAGVSSRVSVQRSFAREPFLAETAHVFPRLRVAVRPDFVSAKRAVGVKAFAAEVAGVFPLVEVAFGVAFHV